MGNLSKNGLGTIHVEKDVCAEIPIFYRLPIREASCLIPITTMEAKKTMACPGLSFHVTSVD